MSLFSFNIKKAILFLSLFAINAATQAQNALLFNGSNSYVEIPYAATNNPAQFTVEFWARVDGGSGTFRAPLSSRQGGPPYNGYNFYANTGNTWNFTGGSGVWEGLSGPAVVIGQWTHLAATYDGTTYRFYVDGVLVNTLVAGFSANTSRPMRIGAGTTEISTPNYYFPGAVDEVKIWNYARSASQINDNKNVNLPVPQTGLMSYYQFEDGLATSKTGINNGTLINAPTSVAGVYSQTTPSGFQTIFYEGFDYTAGQDLYYQSGGNGFTSNWKQSYQNKYLGIQSSGWTYPNLQTTGLRAAYDSSCYGTCNVISSSGRDVPSQTTGVLYLQFLANFGTQLGGGTPHLRLYDASGLKLVIGGNTAANWQLVDVSSNTSVTSNSSLNALRLIIIRLDYDNGGVKMWIDPSLNAFNYSSPPQPTAEIPSNISAPSFNNLQIYLRSNGSPGIDEIHAFKSLPATTFGTFAAITKQYFAGTHTISAPTTNNTNPIVYTSDNAAVATVSGSVITFTGVGTANITATQAADATYEGNAVSTLLTVLGKDLVSKYGGVSSTDVNYVDANGNVGGSLGIDKYGRQESVSSTIITSGLVMHLDAGDVNSYPGSGTTWTDLSGNGNDGTLKNGPTYSSDVGGAIVFDGADDYVDTNLFLNTTTNVTIQGWVNISTTSLKGAFIKVGTESNGYAIGVGGSHFDVAGNQIIGLFSSSRWITTGINYGTGWKFFTLTLSATSVPTIYLNSTLIGSYAGSNPITPSSGVYLGRAIGDEPSGNRAFAGSMVQAVIYNRVLTPEEIQQNYNVTKTRFGL